MSRILAALCAPVLCVVTSPAQAAASAQAVTPINQSVAGNESQTFAVRFFDAQGRPAVGESVQFANDACGVFANGLTQINVTTDATGLAQATFTARPQGITCWLVASAGAQVRFYVITYLPAYTYLSAKLPARLSAGQPFSVTAAVKYGIYPLYNVDIAASIVPGKGNAAIAPAAANSGQSADVGFDVVPTGAAGDFDIELAFRGRAQRFPVKIAAPGQSMQDLWWSGQAENGWGMSIIQHDDILFSVIYAYAANGQPTWWAMPGGTWNAAHTVYSGALYEPSAAPYSAYDTSKFIPGAAVGTAAMDFSDPSNVKLDYVIAGIAGHKDIVREPFGPVDAAQSPSVGDMWWGGAQQNGWGVAVLQQYRTLFAVWYTYDASGAPVWFVMPSGAWSDAQTWEGRVYRTSGSPWLGKAYDASLLKATDVGSVRLRFGADGGATFDYVVEGHTGSIALVRQPF